MIGSLLYLTMSRPNISFSIRACGGFQINSKLSHVNFVKLIIKYISGICEYDIWYSFESNTSTVNFSDTNWVGNMEDKKVHQVDIFTWEVIWWHGTTKSKM